MRMIAVLVRFGGVGILEPSTTTAAYEYDTKIILKKYHFNKERTLENYDEDVVKQVINESKQEQK